MNEFEDEINRFLKSLNQENLDYLIRVGPGLLNWAERLAAEQWGTAYEAKRKCKEMESKAWKDLIGKPNNKGKYPSQKHVEMMLPLDPRVQNAHLQYSKVETMRKKIDALTESLRRALALLPGMQGTANQLLSHG